MSKTIDVKDFLYRWCMKKRSTISAPTYIVNQNQTNKDMRSGSLTSYQATAVIVVSKDQNPKGLTVEAVGYGQNTKVARTNAATALCKNLVLMNLMESKEFETLEVSGPKKLMKTKARQILRNENSLNHSCNASSTMHLNKRICTSAGESDRFGIGCDASFKNTKRPISVDISQSSAEQLPLKRFWLNETQDISDTSTSTVVLEEGEVDSSDVESIVEIISNNDTGYSSNASSSTSNIPNFIDTNLEQERIQLLNEQIWHHFRVNKQSDGFFKAKLQTTAVLSSLVRSNKKIFALAQELHLFPVGSTITGLGSCNSDLDLCLVAKDSFSGEINNDREFAVEILKNARRLFYTCLRDKCAAIELIFAKVPILRLHEFVSDGESFTFDIDINVNNMSGVRNSHLLHYYSRLDERFPPLTLAIKHWAIKANICDARTNTFSSYCLSLLIIHFLQCAIAPALFPSLQVVLPDWFDESVPLLCLRLAQPIEDPRSVEHRNIETLATLLLKFFDYFANGFDFDREAASIRWARKVLRSTLPPEFTDDCCIFVEEPFDGSNAARSIFNEEKYDLIKKQFRNAHASMQRTHDLRSIGITL